MRWSEQYGLRWAEVDQKRNKVALLETKGGKKQHVQLNTAAHAALKKLRAMTPDSEFVCPEQDNRTHRQWWDAVRKAAKITDFH